MHNMVKSWKNNKKRSIKVFEILKKSKGTFEKEINNKVASDALNIHFIEKHRFVSLPHEVKRKKKKVYHLKSKSDHLTTKNNDQENDNKLFELLNLLEANTWKIEEVVVTLKAAETGSFQ